MITLTKDGFQLFGHPLHQWMSRKDFWIGLVLSSLFINVLSLLFPLMLLQVYDRIIPNHALDTLYFISLSVAGAFILDTLLKLARSYVSAWSDARLGYLSSVSAFNKILGAKITPFEKVGSGVHLERINALNTVKDFLGGQAITTLIDIPFVLIFIAFICYIEPRLVLIPLVMQLFLVITAFTSGKLLFKQLRKRTKASEKKLDFIVEVLSNIHTVKALGLEAQLLRRHERLQNTAALDDYEFILKNTASDRISMIVSQVNLVLIVIFGAILVVEQSLTAGGLAACILLSSRMIAPIQRTISLWARLQFIKIADERYHEILNLPQEHNGEAVLRKVRGQIEFKDVSFKTADEDELMLENVNLVIKPKDCIAITSDGSKGKSSVLQMIIGIVEPTSGQVLIDDQELNQLDKQDLRTKISYIPQEGTLFEGTILENMTLFRGKEFVDKAKHYAKKLGLDEVIEQMPEGYLTKVGTGSVDFVSKGIKQKILIVRGFVGYPEVVLFDDANSALDIPSDEKFKEFLKEVKNQCTLIIISHRPSLLNIADKQYLLKNKKLEILEQLIG